MFYTERIFMKKIIFSIYVDIPSDKLDNPGWWENGVQVKTDKSEFTKKQLNRFRDRIIERHKDYAAHIGADYVLHKYDTEYETFCEMFRNEYPQISEYDIINFYKHWLMKKHAESHDLICYFDFDVVPSTREDIFDAHTPLDYFCCAESNGEAIPGKVVDSKNYNHCIRNPASKYWNAHAMLTGEGYDGDTDVFNTGIMIASKKTIQKMDYFGDFKEVLEYMTELKNDEASMYPPNIQRAFNYDNETVFSFKRVTNEVPIQYIDNKWHSRVLDSRVDPDAKIYHVINKEFASVFG